MSPRGFTIPAAGGTVVLPARAQHRAARDRIKAITGRLPGRAPRTPPARAS